MPVIAFTDPDPIAGPSRLAISLNLAGLALLVWGVIAEAHLGLGDGHLAALVLLVAAVAGWVGWVFLRFRPVPGKTAACLAIMGLAGGALTAFAPLGVVFVAVAALGATIAWPLRSAGWIVAAGLMAMLVSVPASGQKFSVVFVGLAAALTGTVNGSQPPTVRRAGRPGCPDPGHRSQGGRRAGPGRAAGRPQPPGPGAARRAGSHPVGPFAAVGSPRRPGQYRSPGGRGERTAGQHQAAGTRRAWTKLGARSGLCEKMPVPLEEELARLARDRRAEVRVCGQPRALSPDVTLALYRVAQEALTNVVKHAPGQLAQIELGFADDRVILSVSNPRSGSANGSPLKDSGGGYGLQGIKERVLLLGGHVDVGPTAEGWLVHAEVPA